MHRLAIAGPCPLVAAAVRRVSDETIFQAKVGRESRYIPGAATERYVGAEGPSLIERRGPRVAGGVINGGAVQAAVKGAFLAPQSSGEW